MTQHAHANSQLSVKAAPSSETKKVYSKLEDGTRVSRDVDSDDGINDAEMAAMMQ